MISEAVQNKLTDLSGGRPYSVFVGRDPELLQHMLEFYAPRGASVLDVTANSRKMWQGVTWGGKVTFSDIDPTQNPDIVADFRSLPVESGSVDVLVFDPPHLSSAAASSKSLPVMAAQYGLSHTPQGDDISLSLLVPFAVEAARVLKPEGVILAKLKDHVHNHQYRWILTDWVNAVRAVPGLTPCDLRIKVDPSGGNLKSGRWGKAHHARASHCWWAVVRKGRCEPKRTT